MLRPWLRRKLLPERTTRAALAAVAAVGYLASIVGYPAAAPRGMKAGAPFPCQHHACGCNSAEECWDHCCCFSLSERLAWADRHKVPAPREVVLEILPRAGVELRDSCASHTASEPVKAVPVSSQRACCAKASSKTRPKLDWTIAIRARGCRGLSVDWVVFNSPIAPPPAKVAWRPAEDAIASIHDVFCSAPEISFAPPTPPA